MKRVAIGATMLVCLAAGPTFAKNCLEDVAGESMARMIGEAGGAQKLHTAAAAQVTEYDRFLGELEKSRGQGIKEAEIEKLRKDAIQAQEANRQIAEAARCYMGD